MHTIEQRLYELRDGLGLRYEIEKDLDRLRARLSRDLSVDELSITVGVQNEQFETAIRVLYDGFTG